MIAKMMLYPIIYPQGVHVFQFVGACIVISVLVTLRNRLGNTRPREGE